MFNDCLKDTMQKFNVSNVKLAEKFGCKGAYISDIRRGRRNPPINRFATLIDCLDELAPGAKNYFGNLISRENNLKSLIETIDFDNFVANLSPSQKAQLLFAIANEIDKKPAEKPETPIIQEETKEKLTVSC